MRYWPECMATVQATGDPSGMALENRPMKIGPEKEAGASIKPQTPGPTWEPAPFPLSITRCKRTEADRRVLDLSFIGEIPNSLENRRMKVPRLL